MDKIVKVGVCQTPEFIGAPDAALGYLLHSAKDAESKNVDLLLFPESFLSGYIITEDYLEKYAYDLESKKFSAVLEQLKNIKPTLIFGISEKDKKEYFNTAVVIKNGRLVGTYRKAHLVPGESLFSPGEECPIFEIKGLKYGINICYDTQFAETARAISDQGAQLLLVLAQNMMRRKNAEKWKNRHNEIRLERVRETGLWLASSDVTGVRPVGSDGIERVAYGPSCIISPQTEIVAQVPLMTIGLAIADIPVAAAN